ncbi:MAG: T9SS type A sorting domain-containing protein [Balneolales bacterium]|nr:T9SS type A sorting domain-containing protein [Balneolales bacterium]
MAQITIDGDMSDWTEAMRIDVEPNTPIVSWHDGIPGVNLLRDNSPANPDDLDYLVEANFKALYVTDDELFLYIRVDMNERADVRRMFEGTSVYDADLYPNPERSRLEVNLSIDPELFEDFQDTTGMTWGWYENGIDFLFSMYPNNPEYADSTEFHVPLTEHTQDGNGHSFEPYQRRTEIGVTLAWNDDWNSVEMAVPKSVILQPVNIEDYADLHGEFVTIMLASGAYNGHTDNQWWSQRIANNLNVGGFVYTYTTEWNGEDPTLTSIEKDQQIAVDFILEQNYPNPFNPSTNIRFSLPEAQNVTVRVFDVLGREIEMLTTGMMAAGTHTVPFNASTLSSGVYIYTVQAGTQTLTGKMMLTK